MSHALLCFQLSATCTAPLKSQRMSRPTFKAAFKKDLSERQANISNGWLKIASALDPRFKDLKFVQREER